MSNFKSWFSRILDKADDAIDAIKTAAKQQFNLSSPIEVVVYNNYITAQTLNIFGRVLERKDIKETQSADSAWDNFVTSYQYMNSDEVPNAKLSLTFQGENYETTSDKEGYFSFSIAVSETEPLPTENPFTVSIKLISPASEPNTEVIGVGKIFRPSDNAQIAIVSDIDDTILQTDATNFWSMAKNTFLQNAKTRHTFAGVSEFYQALQKGKNNDSQQPFFYVSSSPWNLFNMLSDFLELQNIPDGVLLLRDFGMDKDKIGAGTHGNHKYNNIEALFKNFPQLRFVLIGDSGQQDMDIYRRLAENYPQHIAAIYIRDVQLNKREDWEREQLDLAQKSGVEMLLSPNTSDFQADAVKKGLIANL